MKTNLKRYTDYEVFEGPVKLLKMQVMHGANYFSAGPVICMRINLGEFDEVFSNTIAGFYEKLTQKIPSLYEHHCSPGKPGGFFQRVEEGTLLGHIIEHVAIELQTLAGMDVGYGKTRSTPERGVYNVCFRFFDDMCGLLAGKAALNLINGLLLNKDFDVDKIIDTLQKIKEHRLLGPSTQAVVDEIEKRAIPYIRLDEFNLVQLGTGKYQKRIRATLTSDTNFIAVDTADNKYLTNRLLEDAGLPVLKTELCKTAEEAVAFWKNIAKPIVIKPLRGSLGMDISIELNDENEIREAFTMACEDETAVLAQQYHGGASYRFLVIDNKFVAASLLTPPYITGDGQNTVSTLINALNSQPERQYGDKGKRSQVAIDDTTLGILQKNNLTLNSILPQGQKLALKYSGNMKLGGASIDVTDKVHPINIFLAERAAKVIGLNVAGIDILCDDITTSLLDTGGIILEVNAAPDFRAHLSPAIDKPKPVASALVNMLFPPNSRTRVPVFSITGTHGKNLAAMLLNEVLKREDYTVGMATTKGLYINNKQLKKGDMANPENVSLVLKDPAIDCAVLETPLAGIIRRGLGYKYADFGIVLNMDNTAVGTDDLEYPEDVAYAMSVVAEEVFTNGFSVLNADEPLILEMAERLYSKPAFFSRMKKSNKTVQKHILNGGLAVCLEEEALKLYNKQNVYDLINIKDIACLKDANDIATTDAVMAVAVTLAAINLDVKKISSYLKEIDMK